MVDLLGVDSQVVEEEDKEQKGIQPLLEDTEREDKAGWEDWKEDTACKGLLGVLHLPLVGKAGEADRKARMDLKVDKASQTSFNCA